MTAAPTELELKGKSPLRRDLSLRLDEYGHLYVWMHLSARGSYQMLAWTNGPIADSRLVEREHGHCLWIAHSAFDVSAAEAQRIRATYEPLGLRIEKAKPAPASEATVAAQS